MHDLAAVTALGGSGPRTDTIATVTCTEMPDVALASVAARMGQKGKTEKALKKLTGASAPGIERFDGTSLIAIWIGPDQWLVEAPFDTHEDLAEHVRQGVGAAASVTEQTDAWVRFDLGGTGLSVVLELLCPLNTSRMTAGDASRTVIHHLGCIVLCHSEEQFSIYGPRASAGSLHHAILAAMTSAL